MSLVELYNQVAEHLIKRKVVVDFTAPPSKGAIGQAMAGRDGCYYLRINPAQVPGQRFGVFCHEAAHIMLKHVKVATWAHTLKPGSMAAVGASEQSPLYKRHEAQAQLMNRYLVDWVNDHSQGNTEYDWLRSLLEIDNMNLAFMWVRCQIESLNA